MKRLSLALTGRPLNTLSHWEKEGYLLLSPPYQRGDVWGPVRQQNLIFSILSGVPVPSIVVNDRFAAGWGSEIAVIDGKQRATAILKFLKGELKIPGEWVDMPQLEVTYFDLPLPEQRHIKMRPFPFAEGALETLEDEERVFTLINFGGVPQGESDLPAE